MKRSLMAFAFTIPLLLQACGQGGSENANPPPTAPDSMQQQNGTQSAPATPQSGVPSQDQPSTDGNGTSQ